MIQNFISALASATLTPMVGFYKYKNANAMQKDRL